MTEVFEFMSKDPVETYNHRPEAGFEDNLADWFRAEYGESSVEQQDHQSDVDWYCDIVVDVGFGTLFVETESRESEVRSGLSQALGYAGEDPVRGIPMVVAPAGHLPSEERLSRLRSSGTALIREFDAERGEFTDV